MRKKIAILGHSGMLGSTVRSYYCSQPDLYNLILPSIRFGESPIQNLQLLDELKDADFIINCAGAIPQSNLNQGGDFYKINTDLPDFLLLNGLKTIHACTDCVYSGSPIQNAPYSLSSPYDATDDYGVSKSQVFKLDSFIRHSSNFRVIRASVIGPDRYSRSLYSWVISSYISKAKIYGFVNHFWNGITSLQWALYSEALINSFNTSPVFTVPVSERISKFELLQKILIASGYDPSAVHPFEHPISKDKSLKPNSPTLFKPINQQLSELTSFSTK